MRCAHVPPGSTHVPPGCTHVPPGSTHVPPGRARFVNNVDVGRDGQVYFSDVSHRFGYHNQSYELLEARPNGRLLRSGARHRGDGDAPRRAVLCQRGGAVPERGLCARCRVLQV